MSEIRMEVLSESEAMELCHVYGYKFLETYDGAGDNYGKLMMLADDGRSDDMDKYMYQYEDLPVIKEYNTCIYTDTATGRMYLADKNKCKYATTFDIAKARKLTEKEAKIKAAMMCKNGSYSWRTLKG